MTIQSLCPGRLDFAWAAAGVSVAAYFVLRYLNVITLTFTLLRLTSGAGTPVRITHVKHYNDILQRIKSGWIARLRKLHLAVNFENPPKQEERKFKWLLDHEVISEAEYQGAIGRLSATLPACPTIREQRSICSDGRSAAVRLGKPSRAGKLTARISTNP
jgi:hypothetical protein